jgi:hypothetical protein
MSCKHWPDERNTADRYEIEQQLIGHRRRAVRRVALAVLLLAGCASTKGLATSPDAKVAYFGRENQKISESESRCISAAMTSSDADKASIVTNPGTYTGQTMQRAGERDRRPDDCRANAEREREVLSARERTGYQDAAQDERDFNSLIMILTASRPH